MMTKQLFFIAALLLTLAVFAFTMRKYFYYFRFTKAKKLNNIPKRLYETMVIAVGQSRIFRHPLMGFLHAMVFWGFIVILFGSIEMVIDGIFGTERIFSCLGIIYNFMMASGDLFGLFIAIAILVFLFRRLFLHVKRFYGTEMKAVSKADANLALTIIFTLMFTLLGMNTFYVANIQHTANEIHGYYPVSQIFAGLFTGLSPFWAHFWHEFNWWAHILLIFIFANILPYSKHFHVFMSVPNVFVSRIEPLGKIETMESIRKEVHLMLDPNANPYAASDEPVAKFGVSDAEDTSWVNYMNALSCTECGRCTAVCPANITGKLLSPRKIVMDLRARMKEKGPGMIKDGLSYSDGKSLIGNYISEEELWACTMCNACARECPIKINQPALILDMRRYLVLEKSSAPSGLNTVCTNIENNGAPWQFSPQDRMKWADELYLES
ncbi:MAG: 4Fe-4S dicluster domain-containing protein [Bacteroidales bacterium]